MNVKVGVPCVAPHFLNRLPAYVEKWTMQRTLAVATRFGLFSLSLLTFGSVASAQSTPSGSINPNARVGISSVASDQKSYALNETAASSPAVIRGYLDEGAHLESDRRWQEAMHFYEKCFRVHRDAKILEHRLKICRIHHDVGRRYGDATFTSLSMR